MRIIAGQQLSVKAAATIYGRLEHLVGKGYKPEDILNLEDEVLRSIGLSRAKTTYVKAVADDAGPNCKNFERFYEQSNEEVLKILT